MNKDEKDWLDEIIGKCYDLETIVGNDNLNYISMSPHDLKNCRLKKYCAVQLVNINRASTFCHRRWTLFVTSLVLHCFNDSK